MKKLLLAITALTLALNGATYDMNYGHSDKQKVKLTPYEKALKKCKKGEDAVYKVTNPKRFSYQIEKYGYVCEPK